MVVLESPLCVDSIVFNGAVLITKGLVEDENMVVIFLEMVEKAVELPGLMSNETVASFFLFAGSEVVVNVSSRGFKVLVEVPVVEIVEKTGVEEVTEVEVVVEVMVVVSEDKGSMAKVVVGVTLLFEADKKGLFVVVL